MPICDISCYTNENPTETLGEGLPLKRILYVEEWDGYHFDFGLSVVADLKQSEVKDFISKHHRHHAPSVGDKCRFGVMFQDHLIAVAMLGRPVNRHNDDGSTLEVTRLAVNNDLPHEITMNACSKLYSSCCRWAKQNGYKSVITYTLDSERGSSLKASNFVHEHTTKGGSWNCKSRVRKSSKNTGAKKRWRKLL
tara:strand:- start:1176 stop:1757 length:582 start_codon:yes stop_codon:yes gene_type:complete